MTSAEQLNGQFRVGGRIFVKPEAVGDDKIKPSHIPEWSKGPWSITRIDTKTYTIAPIAFDHFGREIQESNGNPVVISREARTFHISEDVLRLPEAPTNEE